MILRACFWITMVMSGISANRLGRYDDDYPEDLRSGKKYSPNMHSYQSGGEYNERYADTDRYFARNLQKTPDYRRNDDDDDGDRSGAYKSGGGTWMGQHYPAKSTYIKPTPASSTTCPASTTPSCVTVSALTTITRLVSICQLATYYTYVAAGPAPGSASFLESRTDTCTMVALPSKLVPDCCSGSSTASTSEPCLTSTSIRTILRDKTCTMSFDAYYFQDLAVAPNGESYTRLDGNTLTTWYLATTCAL